jgi:hypothetical protein
VLSGLRALADRPPRNGSGAAAIVSRPFRSWRRGSLAPTGVDINRNFTGNFMRKRVGPKPHPLES